jgi:hypothetical protein
VFASNLALPLMFEVAANADCYQQHRRDGTAHPLISDCPLGPWRRMMPWQSIHPSQNTIRKAFGRGTRLKLDAQFLLEF